MPGARRIKYQKTALAVSTCGLNPFLGLTPFLTNLTAGLLSVAGATALWAGTTAEWKGGEGNWEDAAMWGGALPSRTAEARMNGTQDKPSQVILAHTNVLVNQLSVAYGGNSLASLILDGPSLTVSGTMDVGKYRDRKSVG